ncbi:MAG: PAS domain S-box protein [Gemmatimonadota bacterium]|nr:PAS domain S-box protein [Gemmatimonadota bacterium]
MSLRRRLLLGVGLTVVAVLAVGITAIIERRSEARGAGAHALTLDMIRCGSHVQHAAEAFALIPAPALLDSLEDRVGELRQVVDALSNEAQLELTLMARIAGQVDKVERLVRAARDLGGLIGAPTDVEDTVAAQQRALVGQIVAESPLIVADALELNERTHEMMERTSRDLSNAVFLSLALLILVVLRTSWWLVRRLGHRLESLHLGALELAGGNLGHRVPESGTDELGGLEAAFNRMARELEGAITYARHKVEERIAAHAVLERQLRQQAAVVELGTLALSDTALMDLEREAARMVAEGLEVELVQVLKCEPGGTRLRLVAGVGWEAGLVGTAYVEGNGASQAGYTLRQGAPVVVDDFERESRFRAPPLLTTHDVRSGISVVIGDADRPYGVLGAHSRTVRPFSADDVGFVQSVANLLAQSLAAHAAQDAVRESERRYQDLYDHAPSMYWSVELATGRILVCNETAVRTLGYRREELVGRSVFEVYAPESHAAVRAGMRTLQEVGEVVDSELLVRRRDGTTIEVSLQATAVRHPEGTIIASRSILRDITARKQVERALQHSLDRLAAAERVAVMGNWRFDAETARVTWSVGHCRLYGLEPHEFDGTYEAYLGMVHPNDRAAVEADLDRFAREKRGGAREYRILRADGEVRYVQATAEVVVDASGRVTAMFGISTDVSERRKLEAQLRHVVEHSTNVFYSHTADRTVTYVSPQVRDVLDCEPEDAPRRWTAFLTDHPENQAGIDATERALATGERQPPYELQLRTARGRLIWVEVREAPLVQDDGTVAMVGALTDITERRRIADALRKEQEVLERIVNNVPVMLGVFDSAGRVQFVNGAWERILGWSLQECRAHPNLMAEFYPDPEEHARVLRCIREASGEWDDFRTVLRDGRVLDTMWANVRLSNGSMIGIGQDITERKAAERALAESEERLRLAVTAANQGLFDSNVRTGTSVVSAEYCRMLGFEPDELEVTHASWLEQIHPDDRTAVAQRYADYIAGRRPDYGAEFRLRTKDGGWKWVLAVGKAVEWDETGRPTRLLGTHTDITERKRAEAEVYASRERIRQMAFAQEQTREAERARMARELHDEMGQDLTGLKMDLSWLRTRLPRDDDDARDRTNESLRLVDTMVDFVRRMSGELRPGVLDDLGLAAAIRWQVRELGRRAGLPVELIGLDSIPEIEPGRGLAVFRIIQEALTNVARHAEATRVEIVAAVDGDWLRLEVRDDGRGLPEDRPSDRTPLGILGMQERAAAWGGTVTVGAQRPQGTVVSLAMPCAGGWDPAGVIEDQAAVGGPSASSL